jgi:hypothetical protein
MLCSLLLLASLDVATLLPEVLAAEEALQKQRERYAYRELQENWDGANDTSARAREYDNIFVEGALYRKLITTNGKPLDEKAQKKVEEALQRTAKERRVARRNKAPFFPGARQFGIGTLAEVARLYDFAIEGEAELAQQRVVILRATPRADLLTLAPERKEMLCYEQRFWVSLETSLVLQREVKVVRSGAELLPGTVLVSRYSAPQGNTVLFETRREIEFSTKIYGLRTARGRQIHTFSDFRRFDVESTVTFEP